MIKWKIVKYYKERDFITDEYSKKELSIRMDVMEIKNIEIRKNYIYQTEHLNE